MSDAQTWTLIGGFFALVVAQTALLLRLVKSEIGRLEARIDGIADRLDKLDRDVHAVITHLLGEGR
jgi:hypothetical protein